MDLEAVKQGLLDRKAELEERLDRAHKHLHHRDEPVSPNFSEQIKQREQDELLQTLEDEGREELRLINRALQRLEEGHYQECALCGEDIGEKRLQALPYAEACIKCASSR